MIPISMWENCIDPVANFCTICMSNEEKPFVSHMTPEKVDRIFHRECIQAWVDSSGSKNFPNCNREIKIN